LHWCAQRKGRELADRAVAWQPRQAGAQHAPRGGVVGGDRREREGQVGWFLQQCSYRVESALEHADAVAMGRRDPQRSEIGQAPDLAVHESVAHRTLAHADRRAAVVLARDDEAVRSAEPEIDR
jgi:hypothetical protein